MSPTIASRQSRLKTVVIVAADVAAELSQATKDGTHMVPGTTEIVTLQQQVDVAEARVHVLAAQPRPKASTNNC